MTATPLRFPATDLLSFTESPPWLLPGLIPVGLTILAAPPFTGQSALALQMATALAAGQPVFQAAPVGPTPVLFIAPGQFPGQLGHRLQAHAAPHGGLPALPLLEATAQWPGLEDEGGLEQVERWLSAHPGALVVFDGLPAGTVTPATLVQLRTIAHRHHAAVLVVLPYGNLPRRDPFAKLSAEFGSDADGLWMLVAGKAPQTARWTLGVGEVLAITLALTVNPEGAGWLSQGPVNEQRISRQRQMILDALHEAVLPLSPCQLAQVLNWPSGRVRRMLMDMKNAGQVEVEQPGSFYRIPGTPGVFRNGNAPTAESAPHRSRQGRAEPPPPPEERGNAGTAGTADPDEPIQVVNRLLEILHEIKDGANTNS